VGLETSVLDGGPRSAEAVQALSHKEDAGARKFIGAGGVNCPQDAAAQLQRLATRLIQEPSLAERIAKEPQTANALAPLLAAAEHLPCSEESGKTVPHPTAWQLRVYALHHCIPFIGFGLCDNSIMILAGDLIDAKLGVLFGISTLAAAAVGNTCSNVVGLWASGFIESVAHSLGIPEHRLTQEQQDVLSLRILKNTSSIVGIVFGCTLGMFPLLYPEEWRLWEARPPAEVGATTSGTRAEP